MTDCATTPTRFGTTTGLVLEAAFDGGRLTSDGGLTCLAEVDKALGLCEAIARSTCPSGGEGRRATRCPRWLGSASFR